MKTDIAQTITTTILAKLEAGTKPWVQPWTGCPQRRPLRHCGTAYRGINTVVLWMEAQARGYASPYWMTYRQAEALGGQVRRGERCSTAVLYKTIDAKEAQGDASAMPSDENASKRRVLRAFAIFNADQIDGLPARYVVTPAPVEPMPESVHRPKLEAFFARLPASVHHVGLAAYYNRTRDEIVLPPVERFRSYDGYFATRAHETAHWTGHEKRLGRNFGKRFGDQAYAFEELVADIASAILGAELGLPEAELENHTAYLSHWIKVLGSDKNAILTAASKADEAVDHIMGFGQAGNNRIVEHRTVALETV